MKTDMIRRNLLERGHHENSKAPESDEKDGGIPGHLHGVRQFGLSLFGPRGPTNLSLFDEAEVGEPSTGFESSRSPDTLGDVSSGIKGR